MCVGEKLNSDLPMAPQSKSFKGEDIIHGFDRLPLNH